MIKKVVLFILILIFLVIVWYNLPLSILYYSEIKKGNQLIENVEQYQEMYQTLPAGNDWKLLKELGFEIEMLGTNPSYIRNGSDFEIVYLEGFDGPYLLWNSKERIWKKAHISLIGSN